MELTQVVEEIAQSAKGCRRVTRIWDNPENRYVFQGDVQLHRLSDDPAHEIPDRELLPSDNHQVAAGTTQGSRHVLSPGPKIEVFATPGPLDGPVIRATEGFYLAHPTHGDIDCRLPGTYTVTYPVDKAAEELGEIRRRRD